MILTQKIILGVRVGGARSRLVSALSGYANVACLHTTSQTFAGGYWRQSKGMPINPNAYGSITDTPDYSYLDGRPTPPKIGAIRRAKEQLKLSNTIMELSGEMDFAVHNHAERTRAEQDRKRKIIEGKLKPKGHIPPDAWSK